MRLRLAALLSVSIACSRGPAAGAPAPAGEGERRTPFDWQRPVAALDLGPDEVARLLGSFEWTGAIDWTVSREGDEPRRVRAVERHRVRQSASGEFEASADIDPGLGPGSDTGRDVVYAGGMTYARARYAPFRERPTDRGRDARRFRDESFFTPRSIIRLLGPALALRPAGEDRAVRRPVRRLTVSLAQGSSPPAAARSGAEGAPAPDDDTKRRLAFLQGLRPQSASGELLLDAETGAPLRVHVAATFAVEGDANARASVELVAQVNALGADVQAIAPPKGALPDERKAAGVAAALEAAGLKKRPEKPEEGKGQGEPAEDGSEE